MESNEYERMYLYEEQHWWFVGTRRVIMGLLADGLVKIERSGCHILDVGCGTGYTMALLQRFGEVYGIDISPEALRLCRRRGLINVCQADAVAIPHKENTFNAAVALDVLEHIEDDRTAVCEINRILKSDGTLVATVPAFNFLWSHHDDALHHKRRYTRAQLRRLLEENGFKIEKISYYNFFLFPLISFIRIAGKLLRSKDHPKSDLFAVPVLINSFLISLFTIEEKLLKHMNLPVGVSLLCIASKVNDQRSH